MPGLLQRLRESVASASLPAVVRNDEAGEVTPGSGLATEPLCPLCMESGVMAEGCTECASIREATTTPVPGVTDDPEATDGDTAMEGDGENLGRLHEAAPGGFTRTTDGRYRVAVIRQGMGNSKDRRVYTADALRAAVTAGLFEGLRAYADHPTTAEAKARPERSIRDLVGHYTQAELVEHDGVVEVQATFTPIAGDGYRWVHDLIESAITQGSGLVGISIQGSGHVRPVQWTDGHQAYEVVEMLELDSADLVTKAGAGGRFLRQLTESLRGLKPARIIVKEDDMKKRLALAIAGLREAQGEAAVGAAITELEAIAQAAPEDVTPSRLTEAEARATTAEQALEVERTARATAEGRLAVHERIETARAVITEADIPDGLVAWYEAELRDMADRDQMVAFVERQRDYEQRLVESVPAGAGPRLTAKPSGVRSIADLGFPVHAEAKGA